MEYLMYIVKFNNVSYTYDMEVEGENTLALKNVSLEIAKGEFLAVVGHNGSGKSTLAKHINALLLPNEGSVIVNGYDTTNEEDLWKVRQSAGMIFQNPDNQIVATIVEEDGAAPIIYQITGSSGSDSAKVYFSEPVDTDGGGCDGNITKNDFHSSRI